MFNQNSMSTFNKVNAPGKNSQANNSETNPPKEHSNESNYYHTSHNLQSLEGQSMANMHEMDAAELEGMVASLDMFDKILNQVESVKKSREALLVHSMKLQEDIRLSEEIVYDTSGVERLENANSKAEEREDILKTLEQMETLLSHPMLKVIKNWADTLESALDRNKKRTD
ncbi:uncharacterized protein LOC128983437 [Macrosteles quadrilineatus]|uniref:uncharacterized protein LOC128983437 n=1 Tax=Macrosteles quadrilineatus TaxID=74068 RepID=UPI0023E1CAD0|nr:uncharacterized protein LOC128983437 [Macrosteles quadrilineatus]